MFTFSGIKNSEIQQLNVGIDVNHIRIVTENVFFVCFCALFNSNFVIKLCIKHPHPQKIIFYSYNNKEEIILIIIIIKPAWSSYTAVTLKKNYP